MKLNLKVILGMVVIGNLLVVTVLVGHLINPQQTAIDQFSDPSSDKAEGDIVRNSAPKQKFTEDNLIWFELAFQNTYCDLIQTQLNFQNDMDSTKYDAYIDTNGSDVPKMRAIGKKYKTIRETLNLDQAMESLSKSTLSSEFSESLRLLNLSYGYFNGWIDGNANLDSFEDFKNEVIHNLTSFYTSISFVSGAYKKEIGYLIYDYPEIDTELTANVTDISALCESVIAFTDDIYESDEFQSVEYPGYSLNYDVNKKDENVIEAQTKLVDFGYDVVIDGYFGQQTKNAVSAFQKQKHLEVDGIVGPLTWGKLFTNKAPKSAFMNIPNPSTTTRSSNNAFYLYGTTSDNCARITVVASNPGEGIYDKYQLKDYEPGDTTFKYGVREDFNNLGEGLNTYTFTAYCEGGQTKQIIKTLTVTTPKPVYTPPVYTPPVTIPKSYLPKTTSSCDPNYSGCVPIASDVDCAGGSGNGPAYTSGPVRVIGRDIYGLDRDNDGYGCE